jgi:hypothetical protein
VYLSQSRLAVEEKAAVAIAHKFDLSRGRKGDNTIGKQRLESVVGLSQTELETCVPGPAAREARRALCSFSCFRHRSLRKEGLTDALNVPSVCMSQKQQLQTSFKSQPATVQEFRVASSVGTTRNNPHKFC